MSLIDRYVSRQLIVTAAFAITVLSLVLVLGNIFKRLLDLLVNHDVPIETIVTFIAYILPFSLVFTIPWGFLTAVLLVMGRMSGENELIALRSSGVSIGRVCRFLFVAAAAACGICLWINLDVAPRAQENMRNAIFSIATSNPLAMFSSDEVITEFPNHKIYVGRKDGRELHNIQLYEFNKDQDPIHVVFARRGEVETDLGAQQVLLKLYDARYAGRDVNEPTDITRIQHGITMKEVVLPISLQELYEKNRKRRGLSQMTVKQLLEGKNADRASAARTEVSKRFSYSFASLAFVLIGVPLGITAHRKETSIGFLFSLVIAFVYFIFIFLADMAKNNPKLHPELLIWAPNVLFIGLGIVLFWRLAKR
jgi:LPS export ABC transporter permease LptF